MDEAIQGKNSSSTMERFVTIDGEIITRSGIIRGGSRKNSEGSLIGKQQQIEELEKREAELRQQVEAVDREIHQLNTEYGKINIDVLDEALAATQGTFRDAERAIGQTEYELKRTKDQLASLVRESEEIALHLAEHEGRSQELVPLLEELEAKYQDANRKLAALQIEMQASEQKLAAEGAKFTEAQVRHTEAVSAFEQKKNEILRLENDIANGVRLLEQKEADIERFQREKVENETKSVELKQMLSSLEHEIQSSETEHTEISAKRKEKVDRIHEHRDALRQQREGHDRSVDMSHQLDLKIQEFVSKLEQLRATAKEQFEMEEIPVKEYPEDDSFSFGTAREQVQQLKSQIRNLGNVNLLAYEEFVKEKERQEFLTQQRTDLVGAQQELYQTIEEINVTATQKFIETFEEVRKNFQEIFRSLFTEGDECELQLEEGADPLEAQIEIIAKPRGKKPHGIESLSGGEKTMTAIALLFAIYLVKPSPFCILDEVDAPLDDANIDRFLQLVRRFTQDTQFIVVTHNKRTMAAADALYGVTQEEDGISKIVSVRLKRELAQAA
jgi:chromosome segregation protein